MTNVFVVQSVTTTNPAGAPHLTQVSPITAPSANVVAKQDPAHTEQDFLGNLAKVTQRRDERAS
jgi:hypothetical protein